MSENNKTTIRNIILSYRDSYSAYHQHKENMSWAASALYIGTMIGIIAFSYNNTFEWYLSLILGIIIILVCYLTVLFVYYQLKNKAWAADIVAACSVLIFNLINSSKEIKDEDSKFPDNCVLPNIIEEERKVQRKKTRSDRNLKDSFSMFFKLKFKNLKSQEIFECSLITVIIIVTLLAIIVVWVPNNDNVNEKDDIQQKLSILEYRLNEEERKLKSFEPSLNKLMNKQDLIYKQIKHLETLLIEDKASKQEVKEEKPSN